MTTRYRHLFFDLDQTLWDHHSNANETLADLYLDFQLSNYASFSVNRFQEIFHEVNHGLWHDYQVGTVDQLFIRKERFKKVMRILGLTDYQHCIELGEEYLYRCPRKINLMPYAIEALNYLESRYSMSIITNGFDEVQDIKLSSSGIQHYFDFVVTSEKTGWLKPHKGMFDFALKHADAACSECVMIGDNPVTDIVGARDSGIDQIYYDSQRRTQEEEPTYRISSLRELN